MHALRDYGSLHEYKKTTLLPIVYAPNGIVVFVLPRFGFYYLWCFTITIELPNVSSHEKMRLSGDMSMGAR